VTDTLELVDAGTVAALTVAEGTAASLTLTYGDTRSPEAVAAGVPATLDPYVRLEWTLPAGNVTRARQGSRFAVYWNGDGSYDGWDWSSDNPPDEPEKRPKARAVSEATRAVAWMDENVDEYVRLEPREHFDPCIVGVVQRFSDTVLLYSKRAVLASFVAQGMTEEEAQEYFDYNTVGGWFGDGTPVFLMDDREET
jgi:hypothetical protein